jgi:hypothetical protein
MPDELHETRAAPRWLHHRQSQSQPSSRATMPRGRQQELRLWLPPDVYARVLRDAAVRGGTLSRCVRDRLEAHLALEEELLHVVVKDVREQGRAAGAALRLRLLDELEARLAATLGHQADSLAQLTSDLRLVVCQLDRAYVGLVGNVLLRDVRDHDQRARQAQTLYDRWRDAAQRLWLDGGPALAPDKGAPECEAKGG